MPSAAPTRIAPAPSAARTDHGRRTTHAPHEPQSSPGAESSTQSPRSRGAKASFALGWPTRRSWTFCVMISTRRSTSLIATALYVFCHPKSDVLLLCIGTRQRFAVSADGLLFLLGRLDPFEEAVAHDEVRRHDCALPLLARQQATAA